MTLDEAIKRYTNNAEYERTDGSLQGCLEFKQLVEWLKELKQLREQTGWIPVSERLPEKGKEVLIYIDRFPYLATYEDGEWNTDNFTVDLEYEPTAWFELPEPYEPQESEE